MNDNDPNNRDNSHTRQSIVDISKSERAREYYARSANIMFAVVVGEKKTRRRQLNVSIHLLVDHLYV
jgi:hypothetical protein